MQNQAVVRSNHLTARRTAATAVCEFQYANPIACGPARRRPSLSTTTARMACVLGVAAMTLAGFGCSTPGPLHLYSIAPGATQVHDAATAHNDVAREVPSYLDKDDRLTGFAYDPFTDHFFLRLAPGNHLRVVDRPARKIKREFVIAGIPDGGDLAVNPRTGHLYFVDAHRPSIAVATRLGKFLESISLEGRTAPATAIAFDATADMLIVLDADGQTIDRYTKSGGHAGTIRLAQPVDASLAIDGATQKLYAPLRGQPGQVGVFDDQGHLISTIPIPPDDRLIDVGPHSFLRVF